MLTDEQIARVAHEVNRAYCMTLGDVSQPAWEQAPEWQRDSVVQGVAAHWGDPNLPPRACHESWSALKRAEGWIYGPEKRPDLKQHPCLVPYEQLPDAQRTKDFLFCAVVKTLISIAKEQANG